MLLLFHFAYLLTILIEFEILLINNLIFLKYLFLINNKNINELISKLFNFIKGANFKPNLLFTKCKIIIFVHLVKLSIISFV